MYTEKELELYSQYLTELREFIWHTSLEADVAHAAEMVVIDSIKSEMRRRETWSIEWSVKRRDGDTLWHSFGELIWKSFPTWLTELKMRRRDALIDELLKGR